MSLLNNIKGNRSGDEGDPGGKFNPFRLLEIGEIMVRYTDGVRIKDFVFLTVLTSERLILIDSASQGAGHIAKEIPFSVIKQAELERDEQDRPSLAISMEVGGQNRVMHLVFTGLIQEPDTECREWFTAINGYPPMRAIPPEIRLDEPPLVPRKEVRVETVDVVKTPASRAPIPPPVVVTPVPKVEERKVAQPEPIAIPPPALNRPVISRDPPAPVSPKSHVVTSIRPVPVTPVSEGSVRIVIEKPDIRPLRIAAGAADGGGYQGSTSWKFCTQCGARTPSQSRFCQTCGSKQT